MTNTITNEKLDKWLRKENLKKEYEFLLVVSQNNIVNSILLKQKHIIYNSKKIVDYIVTEMKPLIIWYTGRERLSTGNCAKYKKLTILKNGICTK